MMGLINFILNLACLLLWLNWRTGGFIRKKPVLLSIAGTLKRSSTNPFNRWISLLAVLVILFLRALFYWHLGAALSWTAILDLGAVALPWRSDYFPRMLIFSCVSFGLTLAVFYSWLLLFSVANRRMPDTDLFQRLARLHLGWVEKLPPALKLLLPVLIMIASWVVFMPALNNLGIVPKPRSAAHLWEQAFVLGLAALLVWRWLLLALFAIHLLNNYIFLGDHPFWDYASLTAKNTLGPLRALRVGPIDFASLLIVALLIFADGLITEPLSRLYIKLPL